MELTEAENIFIRRSVLTFMRPQLLDRLKKNIENNLKDKLEAGSKNRTPRVIDKSELTEVNTSDSNPIADEPVEINGRGARKRRRVEYGDSLKERWYSAVDDDTAAPKTAKKERQIIEKSKKEDQCMKVVSRGRRNIKTKEYSSLNEVMRDVEQLSDHIKAGNERDTMLLLDAIAI
jgi:hypothetical protein